MCAPDNHLNAWITRASTREILQNNKMEITISNSKSSSGNVVTAGYILMKHPIYTQRYFYLLSLRKALPANTPFFDLAIHRRTPHGETIPHIVVKCGENHITGLSEILSSYLDGQVKNTALFVASQAVKSMTQEEIGKMFHAHTTFIDSIQRLSLFPRVVNIDRERQEQHGPNILTRSTREWARWLKKENGASLRCDVENGGTDRRAYLLVPTPHLERAKSELQQYLRAIQLTTQSHNGSHFDGRSTSSEPPRPTEIYIPTPAVLYNLHFLNSLTAAEVWKSAPTSIRNPPNSTPTDHPAVRSTLNKSSDKHFPASKNTQLQRQHNNSQQTTNHPTHAASGTAVQTPFTSTEFHDSSANLQTDTRHDDTTVGTTTSNFTRTTHNHNQTIHNARFQELEAQIQSHQTEFQNIHARFDSLNEQLLRNMQIASTHSAQFSQIERQFSEMNKALQMLLLQTSEKTNSNSVATISQLHISPTPTQAPTPTQNPDSISPTPLITMEVSTPVASPEKKRIRHTNDEEQSSDANVQDPSAQYKESTPVDSDT